MTAMHGLLNGITDYSLCNKVYVTLSHLRSFCGLNVMYHNHISPGVLQLPCCATASQWNVVQLPIGMHKIMLQLPLVQYVIMIPETNADKLNYHSLYIHTI